MGDYLSAYVSPGDEGDILIAFHNVRIPDIPDRIEVKKRTDKGELGTMFTIQFQKRDLF
jgi:hypothetical protein